MTVPHCSSQKPLTREPFTPERPARSLMVICTHRLCIKSVLILFAGAYIPYGGEEKCIKEYQVLCYA
ncbi:hypothetical protein BDN71DRAFT_1445004 [Pleurotus eryngii]|uniref:Uncharacterized protein n=1 Tax=Pleurotus eryngii TaxID=5323 RepID=A0A9P5ZZY4_PLEER|nr:hypothetical protein BDN71DRAFT_1445004 [Pleurotus eryngii]